jgi:flagellar hook assembly protein FlgD
MAFPNPSGSHITLSFKLKEDSDVKLVIHNNIGQVVEIILNQNQQKGKHEWIWDATSTSPGIYFCTLRFGRQTVTKKLIVY